MEWNRYYPSSNHASPNSYASPPTFPSHDGTQASPPAFGAGGFQVAPRPLAGYQPAYVQTHPVSSYNGYCNNNDVYPSGAPTLWSQPGPSWNQHFMGQHPSYAAGNEPLPQSYNPIYQVVPPAQPSLQSGSKKALCIGINYDGLREVGQYSLSPLIGCVRDAQSVKACLGHFGFQDHSVRLLTDDRLSNNLPTKDNIIHSMYWLAQDARPGDSLFFHFSGHGKQIPDLDGDETDGYDEAIVPLDYGQTGYITDDEMFDSMIRHLPQGCRFTAVFDSCHSGSALDLQYMYSANGEIKRPSLIRNPSRFRAIRRASKIAKQERSTAGSVIAFSGCKDSQQALDHLDGNGGAMSRAFLNAVQGTMAGRVLTLHEMLNQIRDQLSGYSQTPQLSSSHRIDIKRTDFSM